LLPAQQGRPATPQIAQMLSEVRLLQDRPLPAQTECPIPPLLLICSSGQQGSPAAVPHVVQTLDEQSALGVVHTLPIEGLVLVLVLVPVKL
jgi:hypothetical protein